MMRIHRTHNRFRAIRFNIRQAQPVLNAEPTKSLAHGTPPTFAVLVKTIGRRDGLYSVALPVGVALVVSGVVRSRN